MTDGYRGCAGRSSPRCIRSKGDGDGSLDFDARTDDRAAWLAARRRDRPRGLRCCSRCVCGICPGRRERLRTSGGDATSDTAGAVEPARAARAEHLVARCGSRTAQHLRQSSHRRGDTVGAKYRPGAGRHFIELFNKYRARITQFVDDVFIVDDFFAHINRRAIKIERDFYNVDRSDYTGTEASRLEQEYFLVRAKIWCEGLKRHRTEW